MSFDAATAVRLVDETTWTGAIEPGWDIFENANGGYMMAIAARAMSGAANDRLPVTVTAHFTRPGKPGPVSIAMETVRVGRTFSTVRADLSSEAGVVLAMLGSFADSGRSSGDTFSSTRPSLISRRRMTASRRPPRPMALFRHP